MRKPHPSPLSLIRPAGIPPKREEGKKLLSYLSHKFAGGKVLSFGEDLGEAIQ
ncbi:MAG: hypothetical protein NTX03_10565 [Bacteroidetes bacterium]|nr:hypothetical protein [Bacteroidota bacterium]